MTIRPPRILALEPDAERTERLQRFMRDHVNRDHVNSDTVVVTSVDSALTMISLQVPDVVLVSPWLSARDEAALLSHLKEITVPPVPPVLVVPLSGDLDSSQTPPGGHWSPFGLRQSPARPPHDAHAVATRIREALDAARSTPSQTASPARSTTHDRAPAQNSEGEPARAPHIGLTMPRPAGMLALQRAGKRHRAHRWPVSRLAWACTLRTPRGIGAQVLNISRSGVLIESPSRLPSDSLTEFLLSGEGINRVVNARVVRTEVATVHAGGVRYRAAAVFNTIVDVCPESPPVPDSVVPLNAIRRGPESPSTPHALGELLARVTRAIGSGSQAAAVRAAFEEEVRRLASAREIRLSDLPVAPHVASESIVFRVPDAFDSGTTLQVVFNHGHEPTAAQFQLLKAAVSVAAVVLEYERWPDRERAAAEAGRVSLIR